MLDLGARTKDSGASGLGIFRVYGLWGEDWDSALRGRGFQRAVVSVSGRGLFLG